MATTDRTMKEQVGVALQEYVGDYNIDDIVDDLIREHGGACDIDNINGEEFWTVIKRHDKSSNGSA